MPIKNTSPCLDRLLTRSDAAADGWRICSCAVGAALLLRRVAAASCFVMGNAQGSPMLPRARVLSLHHLLAIFLRLPRGFKLLVIIFLRSYLT